MEGYYINSDLSADAGHFLFDLSLKLCQFEQKVQLYF